MATMIARTHTHPRSGIVLRSNLITNRQYQCAGDRFWKLSDDINNLLPEEWRATRRQGSSKEAPRKLKVQAAHCTLIKNILYKRGFSQPYLRCLSPKEADYVIREVHEGIFGNHSRSWSLVHKLIWAGYYWPTMQKDAHAYVTACDKCQSLHQVLEIQNCFSCIENFWNLWVYISIKI